MSHLTVKIDFIILQNTNIEVVYFHCRKIKFKLLKLKFNVASEGLPIL